ncbi:MAG: prepilin-type N-terminal cleavage/methylation domain-containing protein [Sedimentisphaerales bacterium]|nr:prepilin-type N-terminal cleavage/methylation domain-containing protein [Sedimentisphaerales bacterium]
MNIRNYPAGGKSHSACPSSSIRLSGPTRLSVPIHQSVPTGLSSHRRRCRGLSLVEILISLAIAALLLIATATAFNAALTSYKANHDMAMASVSARNSMHQMCSLMRSAWNDPEVATINVNGDGTECSFTDASDRDIIYRYDADLDQMQINLDGAVDWYVLMENIVPIEEGEQIFTSSPPQAGDFEVGTVGRVEIRFKVNQCDVSRPVSMAVVPRNVVYAQ